MSTFTCQQHNHITPIIKVVDFCNFSCNFCRYPKNLHKSMMPFSTYKTIVEKVCDYNISNGIYQQSIIFHGGEPLLWGYDNFVSAIKFQEELKKKNSQISFRNSIQTNGALLNEQWIDFFYDNEFDIGISIDGPNQINFHRSSNRLDDKVVIDNLHKLSLKNCKYGILSVLTNEHAGWADKYYDFLVENNIHSVGFCFCIYDEDKQETVDNIILTSFLKRFFVRYFEGDYKLNVREFDNVIKLCLGIPTGSCTFSNRQRCGNFFSVRTNGDVFFCDPYKLDVLPVGNILNESFTEIKSKPNLLKIIITARDSFDTECQSCNVKHICSGGCYRHTLEGKDNFFCETYRNLYPCIEEYVNRSLKK